MSVKLNKVVLENVKNVGVLVVEKKVDNRTNNPGRPVNKKSARYKRLAKQALYAKLNKSFATSGTYAFSPSTGKYISSDNGCIVDGIGSHVCNIDYVGRTKVQGYKFVLGKKVNVELNLKTLKFVS